MEARRIRVISSNVVGVLLKEIFDVIVVGAGPAGSTAAKKCSDYGLETILIEKQSIPRLKPCGGGVSQKALKLIEGGVPNDLIEQRIKGTRFFSPSLRFVDLVAPKPIGITTQRDKFDAYLTQLAIKAGCQLIQADEVIDLLIEEEGVTCKLQSGQTFRGSIIIGADGANSVVAAKTEIRKKWSNGEVGLCFESEVPISDADMKKLDSDLLELYFINIPFGYGWLFPKKSSISLGVGGGLAYLQNKRSIFTDFCCTVSKLKGINLTVPKFEAHLAPAGGFNRKIVADRTMLVGDAAGFIDPFIGEGIYYAMRSGQIAADCCKKAIEEHTATSLFFERNYGKVCNEDFIKDLKVALRLTYLVHGRFDALFNALGKSPATSMIELSSGTKYYRTMQKKLLPKLVFSMLGSKLRRAKVKAKSDEE